MSMECLCFDRISSLPQNIIENILCLMPIRDALRTSVLSKRWQYCWRGMPKLIFTNDMVKLPSNASTHMWKYEVVKAIFHVLLLHNGPTTLEFNWSGKLELISEFDQIISHLSTRNNNVKDLILNMEDDYYTLPCSFFSVQGLEHIRLQGCDIIPPSTFKGFSRLRTIEFSNVEVSAKTLKQFLSNCPLLDVLLLYGDQEVIDFASRGNEFTFVDLFRCAPLIETLCISWYYMMYLSAGGMPHKLPTPLVHLKYLSLNVCLIEHNDISSVLCIIRSSPMLVKIMLMTYDMEELPLRQTRSDFLDQDNHSDLKLNHLEKLHMRMTSSNVPLGMDLVKLIMAKSPMLKQVQVDLYGVSVAEEVIMLRDLVLLPFSRASPSAKLIIECPQICL